MREVDQRGIHANVAQQTHRVNTGIILKACVCVIHNLVSGGDILLARSHCNGDIVDMAHGLGEFKEGLLGLICLIEFGRAHGVLVVGERRVVLLDEVDCSRNGVVLLNLLAVEVVGLNRAHNKGVELLHLKLLHHVFLHLVPLAAEFHHLLGLNTIVRWVKNKVVGLCRSLRANLLRELACGGHSVLTRKGLGQFTVAHVDTYFLILLLQELFEYHGVEHILLAQSRIHLVGVVLVHCRKLLNALLILHDVDLVATHLGCGVVVKERT